MPNYASVTLVGHLGRDPEVKNLPSGDSVTSFSIATNRKRKDEDVSTWWNCSLFGKRGEALAKYLRKGDPVLVHGEPYLRKYESSSGSGQSLDVVVSDFAFVGGKGDQQTIESSQGSSKTRNDELKDRQPRQPATQTNALHSDLDEDIPF